MLTHYTPKHLAEKILTFQSALEASANRATCRRLSVPARI
jgi:hypothetical protein